MQQVLNGTVVGLASTAVMTGVMVLMRRGFDIAAPIPPVQVTRGMVKKVYPWNSLSPNAKTTATTLVHLGYGVVNGVVFNSIMSKLRGRPQVAIPAGATYGALLWGADYYVVGPALGLVRSEKRQPPDFSAMNFLAHLAWGFAAATFLSAQRNKTV